MCGRVEYAVRVAVSASYFSSYFFARDARSGFGMLRGRRVVCYVFIA